MGIKIGDIDIANEIVELNYQILRTQLILDVILRRTGLGSVQISPTEMQSIDEQAIEQLRRKFPNMGITKKNL